MEEKYTYDSNIKKLEELAVNSERILNAMANINPTGNNFNKGKKKYNDLRLAMNKITDEILGLKCNYFLVDKKTLLEELSISKVSTAPEVKEIVNCLNSKTSSKVDVTLLVNNNSYSAEIVEEIKYITEQIYISNLKMQSNR